MQDAGFAALNIVPTFKGFGSKVEAGTSKSLAAAGSKGGSSFGQAFSEKAHSHLRDAAKYIVAPLVGAFAVEKVADLVGESIRAASDLSESQNKVQQVFGKSADSVFQFTATAATKLGQTDLAARDAAATFGIFAHAADLSDGKAAKFSIRMDKLASDLASFHNTSPEQAIEAIGAAMRGESEPIRAYGVMLNDASLKAEALSLGLLKPVKDSAKIHAAQIAVLNDQVAYNKAVADSGKTSLIAQTAQAHLGTAQSTLQKATEGTIPTLTQQQKILAAQSLIIKQTSVAHGDFARTSGGLANQQRILSATLENAKAKLGKGLLPIVTDAVVYLNRHAVPAFDHFATWFGDKGAPAIGDFVSEAKPLAHSILPAIGTALHDAGDAVKFLEPKLKSMFDGFNHLPGPLKSAILLGGGTAYAAKKLGAFSLAKSVLGGGKGGVLGEIATLSKPLPVIVTNPGFGTPGVVPASGVGATAAEVGNIVKRVPLGVSLALGATIAHSGLAAHDAFKRSSTTPTPSDPKALAASSLGAAQGIAPLGGQPITIDFNRLSDELDRYGKASKYALQIQDELTSRPGHAFSYKGGFFGSGDGDLGKARAALDALNEAMDRAGNGNQSLYAHLKATSTPLDALHHHLDRASAQLDLIGPRAATSFGSADRAVEVFSGKLAAIHDKNVQIKVQSQAAVDALQRLQAYRIADKNFTVYQHFNAAEQQVGPGGGIGQNPHGSAPSGRPVRLHVGEREFAAYLDDRIDAHGDMAGERRRAGG